MELELKKLEDLSEAIVNDFAYMRAREEQMRDTNGKLFFLFWIIIHTSWQASGACCWRDILQ